MGRDDTKPPTNNYMKVARDGQEDLYYFFNGHNLESCVSAWVCAKAVAEVDGGTVSMMSPPKYRGQWDQQAGLIGHRSFGAILDDICQAARDGDQLENAFFTDEMDMLQARYRVGPLKGTSWDEDDD